MTKRLKIAGYTWCCFHLENTLHILKGRVWDSRMPPSRTKHVFLSLLDTFDWLQYIILLGNLGWKKMIEVFLCGYMLRALIIGFCALVFYVLSFVVAWGFCLGFVIFWVFILFFLSVFLSHVLLYFDSPLGRVVFIYIHEILSFCL